jgi:hypothetical protein
MEPRSPPEPVVVIEGPFARTAIPGLCRRVGSARPAGGGPVIFDVADAEPDMVLVEAVLRVCLVSKRLGCGMRLRGAPPELLGLLDLCGVADLVPVERPAPS